MAKEKLKENIAKRQNGKSAIGEVRLPKENELWDTDRITPKAAGGIYTLENTRGLDPVSHMKRHGNYREREIELNELKTLMDAREQVRKLVNSFNNRLLALKRGTDHLDEITQDWLKEKLKETQSQLGKIDRRVANKIKSMDSPIAKSALGVKGLGPITVAYMLIYIDIEKAKYCSCLWSYVGLDKPSHNRYQKTVSGGGNKTLRTVLYTMAESMMKNKNCPYREVYDRTKQRLEASRKITESRNTQGKLIKCEWKDTKPCHRHGAALRQIMKHFLADWWHVHRITEGLDVSEPYVIEKLGHKSWIYPSERGWEF